MYVLTSQQMKEIDKKATAEIGIPEVVLMENAGFCVFEEIKKDFGCLKDKKIAIFCGKGNNGGDGFVTARYLLEESKDVHIFIFGEEVTPSSKVFLQVLKNLGADIQKLNEEVITSLYQKKFDIVVDGIFGIGLTRDVEGLYKQVIEYINSSKAYVYSIDIPSGVCSDTGKIKGVAVKANKTITFMYPKVGNILYPGTHLCGKLIVKDIGIPKVLAENVNTKVLTKEELNLEKLYRYPDTHKGDYGKVGVVAGSKFFPGASILCANACVKSGCGLCFLFSPAENVVTHNFRYPEIILMPVESKDGIVTFEGFKKKEEFLQKLDVIAFGCGLTQSEETEKILIHILKNFQIPIVIDADGLNVLAKSEELHSLLREYEACKILTPHYKEASRILGCDVDDVAKNPIDAALEISKRFDCVCILKSARTIITDSHKVFINVLGNPGMAKGGSGDVLTGIVSAMLSQGYDALDAAKLAVYLHSLSADILLERKTVQTILPSEIIENLDIAFRRVIED
ncbi:bifunctional ADP-dependent NAD(P)H-hydrate dehydratase/NAD(P)H-hydrate epimerase [Caldicellulosiruptor naganoensis]|uniref:Bifunctional NAD(P)H-hydrate repair enzyme n=1 Tax=Caldicellulosiruptor naganoensis TaxID=29324 RepID=A0ABY7BKJ7_9FIRM|nr:bifunctional ADP-dependent NAD(P)H-hydrate dehydratase/NAD(P)H-hydrate epimerase [Caldicellulosiruptor naganoensis]WAM32280.1 bifunctional ADP-dependent NAD(P)H-hydrate dehydratase/NAD(P)H-hydrate epimerase [Caldicellulosiruptor naganoensis]